MITDVEQQKGQGSDAERIRQAGIALRYDLEDKYHMHHKVRSRRRRGIAMSRPGGGTGGKLRLRPVYSACAQFAILDGVVLLNGSFNWTKQASEHNNENVMITNDAGFTAEFQQQFEQLWELFSP